MLSRSSFADSIRRITSQPARTVNRLLSLRSLGRMKELGVERSGSFQAALLLVVAVSMMLTGCGSGGYAGPGIASLSSSNITIDAGQSFQVTASVAGNEPVDWSVAGGSCSAEACGSVSGGTGATSTYTAPSGTTSQLKVTLTAALDGTDNSQTVAITVNPDPSISGKLPAGTVGTPYSATLTAAGGTAPLTWSVSGSLPPGLAFDAKTGIISGTPTTVGSSSFTAQIVDSSNVPYTTKASETIAISTPVETLDIGGTPGAGTVGAAYSAQLSATGGTAPYTFSMTSGSLPNGLTLSPTGAITGTPGTAGKTNFTVQVQDAWSTTASGSFSILINPAANVQGLSLSILPGATLGVPYNATIGVTGGTAPYTCQQTAGNLPAGLTLSAACVVSGTPTATGTSTMTVKATDSSSPALTVVGPESITVAATTSLALTFPPNGTVGIPYTGSIGVSGGNAPYTCALVTGSLPAGLAMGSNCAINGTPTTAETSNFTVTVADSNTPADTITGAIAMRIMPGSLKLTLSTLPDATVGVPYMETIGVSGGTAPYTCTQTGGTLPAGLALSAACVVSGTPTTAGSDTVQVKVADSSPTVETVSGPESITVNSAGSLTLTPPPAATAGKPYSGTIGVSGGTAPYNCSIISGSLPAGLALGAGCTITGTPTTPESSTVTVKATDSGNPAKTVTGPVTVTANPASLSLTVTTLPNATVGTPYTAVIGVSGGTSPYSCSIVSGTLPAGLALGANCTVSGTPTVAGTVTLGVKATDSSNPVETTTGPVSLSVVPANSLTLTPPPPATAGQPYSGTIGVSGGNAPYNCSITSGSLPSGLTLGSGCTITGTPTTPGSSTVTVTATDSSNPAKTVSGPVTVTVNPANLSLIVTSLPNATVGTPYTAVIGVSGGTSPYFCSIVSGTLPAGLTLGASCTVSGTPTVAGTVTLSVKATDSSNPVETTTGPVSLTVIPAKSLTLTPPPPATAGQPYSGTIGVSGGTAPYNCSITSGSLPLGLTLGSGCTITGTPTTPGSYTVTVKATDSSSPEATVTGPVTITVNAATSTLKLSSPPNATVGVPYTGAIGVSGGTAPYSCSLVSGTLPAGLSLGAGCTVSGTPSTVGSSTVTIHATDSAMPTANTVTGPVVITVSPVPTLTLTGSLPNATLNVPYSQTLTAKGGVQPYTYSISAGALPAGLSLSSSSGEISGTPTQVGASSFTVTVTDSESVPQTASLPLVLLVVYPSTPNDADLNGPYAFLFQGYDDVLAGVLAYQTATIGSFTADGMGTISAGEQDSNHQSSNPAGDIVTTHTFIGTYTIGTDNRGMMTITTLNSDGTTGETSTFAITAKAPVAPATNSAEVDMIEFDNDNLQGTRGSGTMLAQQPGAFSAGLTGSFAFGVSGDTPCLPACTVGIIAGPAAAVGQFSTDGAGSLTSGSSDANIATTNFANELLTGSYGTTDTNGRLDLSMQTAATPNGVYPTDFAVYMVNASQFFLMSTDKHSSYVLLAGTAQQQTQTTFSNASMNGAIIGYENAQASPGLLGVTLGDVLNLSTATIFRATGNSAGQCDFTNVDVAGLTGLVNGISGLGGLATVQNALLGTYQSTGLSACTVAANGRGTLAYPNPGGLLSGVLHLLGLSTNPPAPREFYLISPNSGYFLETGYAGLGRFEAQSGSPYTLKSLDGTYVYASISAASLASINTSGILTADGAGDATTTADLNVGVGTINLLELGVTGTYKYQLTDATAGRYLLGTTIVFYEIAPGRFVMVDTNPLTTSPTVSLLY